MDVACEFSFFFSRVVEDALDWEDSVVCDSEAPEWALNIIRLFE